LAAPLLGPPGKHAPDSEFQELQGTAFQIVPERCMNGICLFR
jgi:hypothetical protein